MTVLWQLWRAGVPSQGVHILDSSGVDLPLSFLFLVTQVSSMAVSLQSQLHLHMAFSSVSLIPSSVPYRHSSLDSGPTCVIQDALISRISTWLLLQTLFFFFLKKILPQAQIIITLIYFYVKCNKCFQNNFIFHNLRFFVFFQLLLRVLTLTLGRDLASSLRAYIWESPLLTC